MKARAAGGNWIDDGPFWYPTTYAQGIKYYTKLRVDCVPEALNVLASFTGRLLDWF